MPVTVLVIVGRFPCATEAFVPNEVDALRECGLLVHVLACARSGDPTHIAAGSGPQVLRPPRNTPLACVALLFELVRRPAGTVALVRTALAGIPGGFRGLRRAFSALAVAVQVAPRARRLGITRVHAHFLHHPALVGLLVARQLRIPFSASAHARDVFVPEYRIGELCREAEFVGVCSVAARDELLRRLPPTVHDRVVLIRHGVDFREFPGGRAGAGDKPGRPGERGRPDDPGRALNLLTVARLVPKKGIDTILAALALLQRRGVAFTWRVVGEGPERARLEGLARSLALSGIGFPGEQDRRGLADLYAAADLFLLGCRVAADGDRDGVPNAILESMAMEVPVIVADAGGVSEVVRHRETGWLVPPDDPAALAAAVEEAAADGPLRREVARRARQEVTAHHDARRNAGALFERLAGGGSG